MGKRVLALAAIVVACAACSGEDPRFDASPSCLERATIFLDSEIAEARENQVLQTLREIEDVGRLDYHSPADEFAEFKRQYRRRPQFYRGMSASDFPGRAEVTMARGATVEEFQNRAEAAPGINDIIERPCIGTPGPTRS